MVTTTTRDSRSHLDIRWNEAFENNHPSFGIPSVAHFDDTTGDGPRINDGVPIPWPERGHTFGRDEAKLQIFGQVARPLELGWMDMVELPRTTIRANLVIGRAPVHRIWSGPDLLAMIDRAMPYPGADQITVHAEGGYRQTVELHAFTAPMILADRVDGRQLDRSEGGPLRLVGDELAPWRAIKWVRGIEIESTQIV
ncbi:MAG: molybdopterin-dependent oxidoreductase [Acidobacteriota bacterium]